MHQMRAWGLTVALLAGLGGTVGGAEPGDARSSNSMDSGFRRWNGIPPERPKPPAPPSVQERAEKRAKETAAALRAQEEANFLRRLAVCDRLRQLAVETGDDDLEKQADVLQAKAEIIYKQKTSNPSPADHDERKTERRGKNQVAKQEGKR